jgi:hypothetical protein
MSAGMKVLRENGGCLLHFQSPISDFKKYIRFCRYLIAVRYNNNGFSGLMNINYMIQHFSF